MPTVTDKLRAAGNIDLEGLYPEFSMVLSGPTVSLAGEVFLTAKVPVDVDLQTGMFTVELASTEGMNPVRWYTGVVRYLEPDGTVAGHDIFDWKLFVPAEGGKFSELIANPHISALVWTEETPPDHPQPGVLWLKPSTQELFRRVGDMWVLVTIIKGDSGEEASSEQIEAAVSAAVLAEIDGNGFPTLAAGYGGGFRGVDASGAHVWIGVDRDGNPDWIAEAAIINATHMFAGPDQPDVRPGNYVWWYVTDQSGTPTGELLKVEN